MLKIKKAIGIISIMLIVFMFSSCYAKQEYNNDEVELFDMKQGMQISISYFSNISRGDIEAANNFCSAELVNSNKELTEGVSKITSFIQDTSIEGSNYGYFVFNVIRTSSLEPKSDLESFTIKVQKEDMHYKITEVKAKSEKEVFVKGKNLRIIGEDGGKSNLVVNLENIPKDTYIRDNKMMLYKDKVPNNEFGKIGISFSGKRIAVTTTDNKDSYICIAYIDETLMASADVAGSGSEAAVPSGIEELQEILEKPIAKKIVSVDLLKDSKITGFEFSKEEDNLAVNYKNNLNIDRINIYKSDDGSILQTKFDDIFPKDKYSILGGNFIADEFKFNVSPVEGVIDINNELIGEYEMNLITLELKKL